METVLELEDLHTYFFARIGVAKAVCGVSFSLKRGEILGVVGESGSGKSVTALSILRLVPHPGRIVQGRVLLQGRDLLSLSLRDMRRLRGDRISMIFQEPMISLNPAFTVGEQLVEALKVHRKLGRAEARDRAIEMLRQVEVPAAEKRIRDYPHHLSGGMRQRVMIAEALLLKPDVLLADESTTALDVTVQAQVLDLMARLNRDTGTAIMLITHNLGLVAESAQRVVVMYAGRVVEEGPVEAIFQEPHHPYTRGLLRSIPEPGAYRGGRGTQELYEMDGMVPSLFDLPPGCPFCPRCPEAQSSCRTEEPPVRSCGADHRSRCWLENGRS
jgi:peptide/nickel transport system ATP-binding protein/oligopeptide transport system ATP-binding protein